MDLTKHRAGGVRSDGDELVQFNDIYQFSGAAINSPALTTLANCLI